MRLLRAIHSINPATGGPIEGIKSITPLLSPLGWETEVVCVQSTKPEWVDAFPCVVHYAGPEVSSYGCSRTLLVWLKENVKRFDTVVIHGLWKYHGLAVRKVCREFGIPYFVYTHGMLDPWFRKLGFFKHLKKTIYWKLFEHKVLAEAEHVLFTSNEEHRLAATSFKPFDCHGIVVRYGTTGPSGDPSALKSTFYTRFPMCRDRPFLLYLGRLHPKKGLDLLIQAFGLFLKKDPVSGKEGYIVRNRSRPMLVIAGPCHDADYGLELEKLATTYGSQPGEDVLFTGMLEGDEKWGALFAADAFVLPSHQENFGIAVAEALSTATPVLITNKVNIWREVQDSQSGYVENDDLAGISNLIRRYARTRGPEWNKMQENAMEVFEKKFDLKLAVRQLSAIFSTSQPIDMK